MFIIRLIDETKLRSVHGNLVQQHADRKQKHVLLSMDGGILATEKLIFETVAKSSENEIALLNTTLTGELGHLKRKYDILIGVREKYDKEQAIAKIAAQARKATTRIRKRLARQTRIFLY